MRRAVLVFVSYVDEDAEYAKELENHLAPLQRLGFLSVWHKQKLAPGQDRKRTAELQVQAARVIFLVVSPDFLASDCCADADGEVAQALTRQKAGQALVIPILARPADWQVTQCGYLQPLPRNGIPVSSWKERDAAWLHILQAIKKELFNISTPAEGLEDIKQHQQSRMDHQVRRILLVATFLFSLYVVMGRWEKFLAKSNLFTSSDPSFCNSLSIDDIFVKELSINEYDQNNQNHGKLTSGFLMRYIQLDVRVRNLGKSTLSLTRATFSLHSCINQFEILPSGIPRSHQPPSAIYANQVGYQKSMRSKIDIQDKAGSPFFGSCKVDSSSEFEVAHVLKPEETDRFLIRLRMDTNEDQLSEISDLRLSEIRLLELKIAGRLSILYNQKCHVEFNSIKLGTDNDAAGAK